MEQNASREIMGGLYTAFIDSTYSSNLAYRPQFIMNDHVEWLPADVELVQELKFE